MTGHLAFGLLFSLPAWLVWRDRTSAAFVGLAVLMAPVPDVDKWLALLFPTEVHHHGVTHTVVFVALASVLGGALVAGPLAGRMDDWLDERFDRWSLFAFAVTAFLLGGLSHLVADVLSAPDVSTPIEPFWPFFDEPWSLDVVWYDAWWINAGFFGVMVAVHLVLAYVAVRGSRRPRIPTTK